MQAPANVAAALGLAILAAALASGCGGAAATAGVEPAPVAAEAEAHLRFFGSTSFWNTVIPADAVVDPRSPELVAALAATAGRESEAGIGPWISTDRYSVPVYRVPADQPPVEVRLDAHLTDRALQAAGRGVPLPGHARPAAGSDGHLVVWQPHPDRLWEFWRLRHTPAGWSAGWGGAVRHVSRSSGAYDRR